MTLNFQEEHLNMLEGGIIAKLLNEKWRTYAKVSSKLFFLEEVQYMGCEDNFSLTAGLIDFLEQVYFPLKYWI